MEKKWIISIFIVAILLGASTIGAVVLNEYNIKHKANDPVTGYKQYTEPNWTEKLCLVSNVTVDDNIGPN